MPAPLREWLTSTDLRPHLTASWSRLHHQAITAIHAENIAVGRDGEAEWLFEGPSCSYSYPGSGICGAMERIGYGRDSALNSIGDEKGAV